MNRKCKQILQQSLAHSTSIEVCQLFKLLMIISPSAYIEYAELLFLHFANLFFHNILLLRLRLGNIPSKLIIIHDNVVHTI